MTADEIQLLTATYEQLHHQLWKAVSFPRNNEFPNIVCGGVPVLGRNQYKWQTCASSEYRHIMSMGNTFLQLSPNKKVQSII